MNINPDWILVGLQVLPFFTVIIGLNVILFKPMMAYLAARRAATVGERKVAEALQEKATLKLQQWEAALSRANGEVAEYRSQKRAEAQAVHAKRIAQARAEAEVRRQAKEVARREEALRGASRSARQSSRRSGCGHRRLCRYDGPGGRSRDRDPCAPIAPVDAAATGAAGTRNRRTTPTAAHTGAGAVAAPGRGGTRSATNCPNLRSASADA